MDSVRFAPVRSCVGPDAFPATVSVSVCMSAADFLCPSFFGGLWAGSQNDLHLLFCTLCIVYHECDVLNLVKMIYTLTPPVRDRDRLEGRARARGVDTRRGPA